MTISRLLSITLDKYRHSFEIQKRASIELMGSHEPEWKPTAGPVMDFSISGDKISISKKQVILYYNTPPCIVA